MIAGNIKPVSDEYKRVIIADAVNRELDGPDFAVYREAKERLDVLDWMDPYERTPSENEEWAGLCRVVKDIERRNPLSYETFNREGCHA